MTKFNINYRLLFLRITLALFTCFPIWIFGQVQANNITESSDCKDIVDAYELAVRKNITALRKIKNGAKVTIEDFENIDKDIRKWQDIVMKRCAYEPKYSFRVINIMQQLQLGYSSTFPSLAENSGSTSSKLKSTSSSSQGSNQCSFCKPSNREGWSISDYNTSSKTFSNFRYVIKPGYKPCSSCQGTGDCRIKCSGGKRDCPGICSDSGLCLTCKGERFEKCNYCNGTGTRK